MGKILNSLFALILSANAYTIAYTETNVDEQKDGRTITVSSEIQEDITVEKLNPVKGVVTTTPSIAWWTYPTDIKEATKSGDDLLVLVNKEYQLPSTYAPADLVSICSNVDNIRCVNNVNFLARNIIIEDLRALANAARSDGVDLSIRSAYRSYNTQSVTYNHWLSVNGGNIAATDKISARPGHSQHQLGTTIDFSTSEINDGLGGTFAGTQASNWLADNAYKYGFVIGYPSGHESVTGYNYEAWHYRYIGREYAQDMVNSGMILELYLRSRN
jgi:zinc D-Ala-D-Ala carboxypeptidase